MKNYLYLIVLFFPASLFAFSGKGTGTEEDPYQITNVQQLQEMKDDLEANYILMNDIDASETRNWNIADHDDNPATPDSAMGFEPVGKFRGYLDGKGSEITSLYINRPVETEVGLFGSCLLVNNVIKNIKMDAHYIVGQDKVGSLCGYIEHGVTLKIENCVSYGKVIGRNYIGGLIGTMYTEGMGVFGGIKNSYTSGAVRGNDYVGGFAGFCYAERCASDCEVIASGEYKGGFAGVCVASGCYATGDVFGSNLTGGFAGSINNCYECFSTGNVNGNNEVGGFCGSIYSVVSDCYATGDVNGQNNVGGFCGSLDYVNPEHWIRMIEKCYSKGSVSGDNDVGGFCGFNEREVVSSFWDTQTSGISASAGGEGKTTAEMMTQSTYEGWDFEEVWCLVEGKTYPHLRAIEDCDNLVSVKHISQNNEISIHPNPFNQLAIINYELRIGGYASLELYDMLGNKVATLVDGYKEEGEHNYELRMTDYDLHVGMYMLRMMSGAGVITENLIHIR
jgi:hypothetical protein